MFQLSRVWLIQLLISLLISSTDAVPAWHISIIEGRAPSSEDGPPLSDSALRDPSYIPIQVGSIIGAYLLFIIITGIALLFVGRRLRRAAQASPRTLAMEMLKPGQNNLSHNFGPSPISPASDNPYGPSPISTVDMKSSTWPSPEKTKSNAIWPSIGRRQNNPTSMQSSVVTFDNSVIEDDIARNQQEMDRLYAAVMEHEEHRFSSQVDVAGSQNPPELQHLRSGPAPQPEPPRSDTDSPARTVPVSPRKQSRPSPIATLSRLSSRSSLGSFGGKRGVRNLPISPPIGSPELEVEKASTYGESAPLTPRIYEPGPPPPTPPTGQPAVVVSDSLDESRPSPRYGRFPRFGRAPRTAAPTTLSFSESSAQPEPQPHDKENNIQLRNLASKQKRTPAPLALHPVGPENSNSRPQLFTAPLPLRNSNPSNQGDRPPSMIKATVLERKIPEHLRGPRTGVPATPYSPYMPFTPLTPMTPSRLVTKQERKRMEKEAGRRVATVEDAVIEEGEMWGDAYK